jgi:hypothetical protein
MSSQSISQRAQRCRAAEQAFSNSDFSADGDRADTPFGNGWFDSSFELRQGLEVIEWMLPSFGPGEQPAQ